MKNAHTAWKWLLVMFGILTVTFLAAVLWPPQANAGWFDFIGETATAISDATWKVALISALERTFPSIILLACILGAIICAWIVGQVAIKFGDTARQAFADNKVTGGEGVVLVFQGLITLSIVAALGWFGWFLILASRSGLGELMG